MQSRPFRVRNKLVSRQKMSKIEVQVFSSGPETKTFRLYVRITTRKFIVSFDLTSVWVAKIYRLACFQRESTLWLLVRVLTWRTRLIKAGKIPLLDCQRDSHATSQTVIYANIAQTGRIRVYCSWFWVVLVGFVGFIGGFGSFWVVLVGSVFK